MRLLLSNDDGYQAQGLAELQQVLLNIADEVIVVAPQHDHSGCSSLLTVRQSMKLSDHGKNVFSLEGTPADCVRVGLSGYLCKKVDLVISGINHGPNLAYDVLYSGTVAAAKEAVLKNVPGIAVSIANHDLSFLPQTAHITANLIRQLWPRLGNFVPLLNINIPGCSQKHIGSVEVTKLGQDNRCPEIQHWTAQDGSRRFHHGSLAEVRDKTPGTDCAAVINNNVSISVLSAAPFCAQSAVGMETDWLQGMTL